MRHQTSWRRPRYCSADSHHPDHLPLGKGSGDVTCPTERSTLHARAGSRTSLLWGPGLPRAPGPSKCARPHSDQGVRDRPTPLLSPGHCRTATAISAGPRTKCRATATRAAFPQCTSYSVRPLYPAIQGRTTTSAPLHSCTPPLLTTIKGEGGLPFAQADQISPIQGWKQVL